MAGVSINLAVSSQDVAAVRELMAAYGRYLEANPHGARICLEDYERELAGLPAPYLALLLARADGAAAGCAALKAVRRPAMASERACEMKRLWVGLEFRGLGLGRRLVEEAIAWAKQQQYDALYLDTVPAAFPEASRLYQALGFVEIERYNDNLVKNVAFFRLKLS